MERDSARRDQMKRRCADAGIEPVFFSAIDGRALSEKDRLGHTSAKAIRKNLTNRPLTAGEIGCALSHLAIYQEILQKGISVALILEDDVLLGDGLKHILASSGSGSVMKSMQSDKPQMLQLSYVPRGYRLGSSFINESSRVATPACEVWRTSGYIINLAGARSLLDGLYPLWTTADDWTSFHRNGLIKLKIVSPPVVLEAQDALVSSLEDERKIAQLSSIPINDPHATQFVQVVVRTLDHESIVYRFLRRIYRLVRWLVTFEVPAQKDVKADK